MGESVVAHLGFGDWIVVDSCVDRRTGENVALRYLDRLNIDASAAVRAVVATHAHDDHVGGISSVVEACPAASFVCPAATTSAEFFAMLEIDEVLGDLRLATFSEFRRIAEIFEDRRARRLAFPYVWAIADRPVYVRDESGKPKTLITALSPSDTAVTIAKRELLAQIPRDGDRPKRLAARDPNTMAVALWIQVGDIRVLLGSDLLTGPGEDCGWNAAIRTLAPGGHRASVYKVAHHGAPNAHHEGIWDRLLVPKPWAGLTPYRRGSRPRPSEDDIQRLCNKTPNAYVTASPRQPLPTAHLRSLASSLSPVARNVREPDGRAGHIRFRTTFDRPDTWDVSLDEPARALCR